MVRLIVSFMMWMTAIVAATPAMAESPALLQSITSAQVADANFQKVTDMVFDQGKLIVADQSRAKIIWIDPANPTSFEIEMLGDKKSAPDELGGIATLSGQRIVISARDDDVMLILDRSDGQSSRFGAKGDEDGELTEPVGVAASNRGRIYIAEQANNRISVFTHEGLFLFSFGDDLTKEKKLSKPFAVGVDGFENVYVLDSAQGSRLSIFDFQGKRLKRFSASNMKHLFEKGFQLTAMHVTSSGKVFLAERRSGKVILFDPKKNKALFSLGLKGKGRGQFSYVNALAFDGDRQLAIADTENRKIELFSVPDAGYSAYSAQPYLSSVRLQSPGQAPCPHFEYYGDQFLCLDHKKLTVTAVDAQGQVQVRFAAKFKEPVDMSFDEDAVYVLDRSGVKVFGRDGVLRFEAGSAGRRVGEFKNPAAIAIGKEIFVADTGNKRVQVFSKNGVFAHELLLPKDPKVKMQKPSSIAVDAMGRTYVGDSDANAIWVFGSDNSFLYALQHGEDSPNFFEEIHDIETGPDGLIYALVTTPSNPNAVWVYDGKRTVLRFGQSLRGNGLRLDDDDLSLSFLPGGASSLALSSEEDVDFARFDVLHVPKKIEKFYVGGDTEYIQLRWDDGTTPAYRIYAAAADEGPFRLVEEVAEKTLRIDRETINGESYFTVVAVSAEGMEGPRSDVQHDLFQSAYGLFRRGDYARSFELLEQALQRAPEHVAALEYAGKALIKLGRLDDAVQYLERLHAVAGYETQARNQHIEILLQQQQWLQAKMLADKTDRAGEADAQTYNLCSQTRLALDDMPGAALCLEKAIELEPSESRWLLALAQVYHRLGAKEKSQAEIQRAVQLAGDNPLTWIELARLYRMQESADDAIYCYQQALTYDPENVLASVELAALYFKHDKVDEARKMALEISEKEDGQALANYLLGEIALIDGKNEAALIYLAQAREMPAIEPFVWRALARAYEKTGDAAGRMTALQKLVAADPGAVDSRMALAGLCETARDYACVIEQTTHVLLSDPRHYRARSMLAAGWIGQGNYTKAREHAKAAVKLEADNVSTLTMLAEIERQLGDTADALRTLELARKLSDKDPGIYKKLAEIYLDSRSFELAQSSVEQAIALLPAQPEGYALLGEVLLARQMFDQAIQAFNDAIKRSDNPEYQQRLNYAFIQKKNITEGGGQTADIALENFTAEHIFAAAYKSYADTPVASVQVRNLSGVTYRDVKLSFYIKVYMDFATTTVIPEIGPNETIEIPLVASFNNNILSIDEDTGVQSEIKAEYYSRGRETTAKLTQPVTIFGKNAMLWGNFDMVGAFVTPKDEALSVFTRQVVNRFQPDDGPLNKKLVQAMTLFQTFSASGIKYLVDPNSPYSELDDTRVDTVQFPRETLRLKSGDCDDLSILLAAAFENLGIETALLDVPAHLLMMFNTGLPEEDREKLSLNEDLLVIRDGMIWIPVEATLIAASFSEAWVEGARKYQTYSASQQLEALVLRQAWQRYTPVTLPPVEYKLPLPEEKKVQDRIQREWSILAMKALERLSWPYQSALLADPENSDARMQIAIIYARNGLYDLAEEEMSGIKMKGKKRATLYNNLGSVYFLNEQYKRAGEQYKKAIDIDKKNADIQVNLALVYYKQGDIRSATETFERAVGSDASITSRYEHFAALISR